MILDAKRTIDKLVNSIAETTLDAGRLIVPLSGGSDSALTFYLCAQAYAPKVAGIHIKNEALSDFPYADWANKTGFWEQVVPAKVPAHPCMFKMYEELRWALLLSLAKKRQGWLVGSRNRTEDVLGTYSLASRVATYLPISNVWKSDVLALCRYVGVPDEIIASSRRADPECGRLQEMADIRIEDLDDYLRGLWECNLLEPQREYVEILLAKNRFKHFLPMKGIVV